MLFLFLFIPHLERSVFSPPAQQVAVKHQQISQRIQHGGAQRSLTGTSGTVQVGAMVPETALLKELTRLFAHGAALRRQARRYFGVSPCLTAKVPPPRKPRETVDIPGLEMVTYGGRMHYVPGLAKPANPHWERDYKDPRHYRSPPGQDMPLYKEKPCYVFSQRTSLLEGKASVRGPTCGVPRGPGTVTCENKHQSPLHQCGIK